MAQQISDAELRIMKIIWKAAPRPVRFAELMEELAGSGHACQKNTLITLLGRLNTKGFVHVNKVGRLNEYSAAVDSASYQQTQARGFVDKYYEGNAAGLVNTLINADLLTHEEYEELRRCLVEKTS